MQVLAPAKINLSLRVLGRRGDGFHEIETFIAPISLCDEITIEKRSGKQTITFRCDDPSVPKGEANIVMRAANLFFKEARITSGLSIELKKTIPHGAGLGGGSSDAASTLLALNELFGKNLSREVLAKMAGAIGSDVPFFIFQSAAVCKGRGELARTVIAVVGEACIRRSNAVGVLPVARLARNSRRFLCASSVRQPNVSERFGASGF
jgi:4-diphosphocytidyl-2-C-methyl-D-erythritol kinase